MKDWRDGSRIPKKCLYNCEYFSSCGAGCRMNAKYCDGVDGMDPLATSSCDVINIPQAKPEIIIPPDFHNRTFTLNNKARFRKEDFGGVINLAGTATFINKLSYTIISEMGLTGRSVTVSEVQSRLELSEDPAMFFAKLIKLGIINSTHEKPNI